MTTTHRCRPEVEALEERTVLSAGHFVPVALAHHGHHHRHHRHKPSSHGTPTPGQTGAAAVAPPAAQQALALSGQVSGTWNNESMLPDAGGEQMLMGAGTVAPLGQVQMSGVLHTPGFIAQGKTTGTVTLTNADGSVTVQLVGPQQPGFSQPPPTFQYTITGGTGKYAGASGSGTATFEEQPERRPVCTPGTACPDFIVAASFTMTFVPAAA